jgi:hypothetical protein
MDVFRSDDLIGSQTQPSSAYRVEAILNDIILLSGSNGVAFIRGWEDIAEARAIRELADAMRKKVILLPEIQEN